MTSPLTYLNTIAFPTLGTVGFTWTGIRLHQTRGQHDVCEITGMVSQGVQWESGTPVALTFGGAAVNRTWVGYLHTAHAVTDGAENMMNLTCVGPSYALAGGNQFTWVNTTASAVVQQLATARGMACDVTPTTRVYEHLSQAGMTEWQLLARLAAENGRFLTMDGATVRFLSRESILAGYDVSTAPLFGKGSVVGWTAKKSEDPGGSSQRAAIKSFSGVDPRTVTVLRQYGLPKAPHGSISGQPTFTDVESHAVVNSLAEAAALSDAAIEASSWKYRLAAKVIGNAGLMPGTVITMQNSAQYSGTWVVEGVQHVADNDGYRCEMDLVTDALGELPRSFTTRGVRPPVPATPLVLYVAPGAGDTPSQSFANGRLRWQARSATPVRRTTPTARISPRRSISGRG